jgi:hypothetical protein
MNIIGLWKAHNVIMNDINYISGQLRHSQWELDLHILSKINNQYICRIVFHNLINQQESGHEFLLLNYDPDNQKITGIDSNSYLNGSIKNGELHLISTGFEHIKHPKNKFITSYNTIFIKYE